VYSNFAEVIEAGAHGVIVPFEPLHEYFAMIALNSAWVEDNWLPVDFGKADRDKIKLRNLSVIGDQTYIAPLKFHSFGFAVGVGDSMKAAISDCIAQATEIEAYQFDAPLDALAEADETVEKGLAVGISF